MSELRIRLDFVQAIGIPTPSIIIINLLQAFLVGVEELG
jgi:hypothetical protein